VFLRSVFALGAISAVLVLLAYLTHPTARPLWQLALGALAVAGGTTGIVVGWRARKNGIIANPWALILGPFGVSTPLCLCKYI
jgi:hypothetical protein